MFLSSALFDAGGALLELGISANFALSCASFRGFRCLQFSFHPQKHFSITLIHPCVYWETCMEWAHAAHDTVGIAANAS
jgi:hypothetical protein